MASVPFLQQSKESLRAGIRPFDVQRDLVQVANLVEQCFADTLDNDGKRYIQRMRTIANNKGLTRLSAVNPEWASIPTSGFVWENGDQLVGNTTLIPFKTKGKYFFLIANVAVHPDFRRQGIARSLTIHSLQYAQQRGAHGVWLHVRQENDHAVNLYRSLGFREFFQRTTWLRSDKKEQFDKPAGLSISRRFKGHWSSQLEWLKINYPAEVTWHSPLHFDLFKSDFIGWIQRLFLATRIRQWHAITRDHLHASLFWQASPSHTDYLWLAGPQDCDPDIIYTILDNALKDLPAVRPLKLDYPADQFRSAIQAAGFYDHQTLTWMSLNL